MTSVKTVVCDVGDHLTRAGFAGDLFPKTNRPTFPPSLFEAAVSSSGASGNAFGTGFGGGHGGAGAGAGNTQ